jgi:hypothetical protein
VSTHFLLHLSILFMHPANVILNAADGAGRTTDETMKIVAPKMKLMALGRAASPTAALARLKHHRNTDPFGAEGAPPGEPIPLGPCDDRPGLASRMFAGGTPPFGLVVERSGLAACFGR